MYIMMYIMSHKMLHIMSTVFIHHVHVHRAPRRRLLAAGEDKNFAGRVTAWGDGEHTVAYDDGEELTETLYWPNGSPGFVLLSERAATQ